MIEVCILNFYGEEGVTTGEKNLKYFEQKIYFVFGGVLLNIGKCYMGGKDLGTNIDFRRIPPRS